MNEITILGIDLAKNTFQLIGVDKHHKVVMKRRCQRDKLVEIVTNLPSCTILMESCGTSNYWGRRFQEMGHTPAARDQLASAANTCRGSRLIARNNAFAGPVGSRLPCSQFLNVPKLTSIK